MRYYLSLLLYIYNSKIKLKQYQYNIIRYNLIYNSNLCLCYAETCLCYNRNIYNRKIKNSKNIIIKTCIKYILFITKFDELYSILFLFVF